MLFKTGQILQTVRIILIYACVSADKIGNRRALKRIVQLDIVFTELPFDDAVCFFNNRKNAAGRVFSAEIKLRIHFTRRSVAVFAVGKFIQFYPEHLSKRPVGIDRNCRKNRRNQQRAENQAEKEPKIICNFSKYGFYHFPGPIILL